MHSSTLRPSRGAKSDAMYNIVRTLRSRGVPIDGVGFQSHQANDCRKVADACLGALPFDESMRPQPAHDALRSAYAAAQG